MKTAAIVLAAGASRRLGQPKQDIVFKSESLLERTVRIAKQAALDPVYVIVAQDRQFATLLSAKILVNADAAEGMASSIRTGVHAAMRDACDGAVILACDQPAVTAEHLLAIVGDVDTITASSYSGRKGVPAYFPASAFAALLKLQGDTGARNLLASAPAIELANGELDIDTAEDLASALKLHADGRLP